MAKKKETPRHVWLPVDLAEVEAIALIGGAEVEIQAWSSERHTYDDESWLKYAGRGEFASLKENGTVVPHMSGTYHFWSKRKP